MYTVEPHLIATQSSGQLVVTTTLFQPEQRLSQSFPLSKELLIFVAFWRPNKHCVDKNWN